VRRGTRKLCRKIKIKNNRQGRRSRGDSWINISRIRLQKKRKKLTRRGGDRQKSKKERCKMLRESSKLKKMQR
jgi:hypothetical protein